MLGLDIATALPGLRAEAESRMVDEIVFTRGGGVPTFNSTTGEYSSTAGSTSYSGKCEVQISDGLNASDSEVGGALVVERRITVKIPVSATGVRVGDVGTPISAANDSELVGKRVRVIATHAKTYATARRLQVEEVSL